MVSLTLSRATSIYNFPAMFAIICYNFSLWEFWCWSNNIPQLVFILLLIIYLFENVFILSGEFFLINPGIVFNVFSICKESILNLNSPTTSIIRADSKQNRQIKAIKKWLFNIRLTFHCVEWSGLKQFDGKVSYRKNVNVGLTLGMVHFKASHIMKWR